MSQEVTVIDGLREMILHLKAHVLVLQEEITALKSQKKLRLSNPEQERLTETYVAELLGCIFTPAKSAYVLEHIATGTLFEVKYSGLSGKSTGRWKWNNVFGSSGENRYHRLILAGEYDRKNFGAYKDIDWPPPPYVLFDVPFENVSDLAEKGSIQINSKPLGSRKKAWEELFYKYHVSVAELTQKYPKV